MLCGNKLLRIYLCVGEEMGGDKMFNLESLELKPREAMVEVRLFPN